MSKLYFLLALFSVTFASGQIVANDNTYNVNSLAGNNIFNNVLFNDTLNGIPPTQSSVTIAIISSSTPQISINSSGVLM